MSGLDDLSQGSYDPSYQSGKRVYMSENRNRLQTGEIVKISLGLLTKEELEAEAVIDLSDSLIDKSSVNDLRMGAINPKEDCITCQGSFQDCQGHFGMLSFPLEAAFPHPYYLKHGLITAVLNIFCFGCSDVANYGKATLLFTRTEIQQEEQSLYHVEGEKRIKNLADRASGKTCSVCSKRSFVFGVNKNGQIVRKIPKSDNDSDESEIPVRDLLNHFKSITKYLDQNDLHWFLGFERVDYSGFIVQAIPIIPPRNRPSNMVAGITSESDITLLYLKMMDSVRKIKNYLRDNQSYESDETFSRSVRELRDDFQNFITGDADNAKGRSSGNNMGWMILKTIMDKKSGLRLGNAVSARVNNSGRTVIICNNNIKPTEAKIPRMMAEIFRLKAVVTPENISLMTELMKAEVIKSVITDGEKTQITQNNFNTMGLKIGSIVHRRLLTGDIVIINRQPSLHRWNNIALKAVVDENIKDGEEDIHAIGLNTGYVSGLNADFDGDEAHIHVPDSIQARAEAAFLMAPDKAPINDKDSKNIFTVIQNSVWGAYTMTVNPIKLDREEWYRMTKTIQDFTGPEGSFEFDYYKKIKYIEENAGRIFAKEGVTGLGIYNTYTLISMAFPSDFAYMNMIVDGIMVRGVLKKSISGAGEESIIRHMFESHGSTAISVYIHVMQQVTAAFMNVNRHSLSLSDFCPSENLQRTSKIMIEEGLKESKKISQRSIKGIFDHDLYEKLVSDRLSVGLNNEMALIFDPEIKKAFIKNSGHHLFDVLQAQKNRFYKGLADYYWSEELIDNSLKYSIEKYIRLPELSDENFVPGNLIKVIKRSNTPSEQNKAKLYGALRGVVFNIIRDDVIYMVQRSITNPMISENSVCLSRMELATIEADTMDYLDNLKEKAGKLLKAEKNDTSLGSMIDSGARGNIDNQIKAQVLMGQQTMNDGRLDPKISGGTRVNAFFLENSPDPKARGFVAESLYQGLSPQGWLSSAMPSRQTQMDTNFKTKDTGYAAKKMMASAGDYVVRADGTVRDEQDRIISFSPSHFIDPSRMIKRGDTFSVVNCQQLYNEVRSAYDAKEKIAREYNRKW